MFQRSKNVKQVWNHMSIDTLKRCESLIVNILAFIQTQVQIQQIQITNEVISIFLCNKVALTFCSTGGETWQMFAVCYWTDHFI